MKAPKEHTPQQSRVISSEMKNKFIHSSVFQRLKKKTNLSDKEYKTKARNQVIVWATYDGKELGPFFTSPGKHAEDNLINDIIKQDIKGEHLKIYISTSPCSSTYGTSKKNEGCHERIERELKHRFGDLHIYCDHLYQPKDVGIMERENSFPTGFSSFSSAISSDVPIYMSKLPRNLSEETLHTDVKVAQL